jgi:hypothetical protein
MTAAGSSDELAADDEISPVRFLLGYSFSNNNLCVRCSSPGITRRCFGNWTRCNVLRGAVLNRVLTGHPFYRGATNI